MENFESVARKNNEVTDGFILREMGLVQVGGLTGARYSLDRQHETEGAAAELLGEEKEEPLTPEALYKHFPEAQVLESESLLRPVGDTTLFTTAGVQRIETLLREEGELKRQVFAVTQPVVRSQYMDKVRAGVSTSFVNFSIEAIRATPIEYAGLCKQAVGMLLAQGLRSEDIHFSIDKIDDRWGPRKFSKTVITFFVGETEVGEGVFMHDYPVSDDEQISIVDICFGIERLGWALRGGKDFFPGFESFYETTPDPDRLTPVIDCIRTSTLMLGEGVTPSHRDPGYRVRQLSKRFVSRNDGVGADAAALVRASNDYWQRWGHRPRIGPDEITKIIGLENERSQNVLFLSQLEKHAGKRITIEVNQSTDAFLLQAERSLPKNIAEVLKQHIPKKP